MSTTKLNTSVVLDPKVVEELAKRPGSQSAKINRWLENYTNILRQTKLQLSAYFTEAEKGVLLEAYSMMSGTSLTNNLQATIRRFDLGMRHETDDQELIDKLDRLDLPAQLALEDSLECFRTELFE